jgi:hypothetical protein
VVVAALALAGPAVEVVDDGAAVEGCVLPPCDATVAVGAPDLRIGSSANVSMPDIVGCNGVVPRRVKASQMRGVKESVASLGCGGLQW